MNKDSIEKHSNQLVLFIVQNPDPRLPKRGIILVLGINI